MSRLYNILNKLATRNGTALRSVVTKSVAAGTITTLCTLTIPTAGTWLIVSGVLETMNSSTGNKTLQNRVIIGDDTERYLTSSGVAVGRTTNIPQAAVTVQTTGNVTVRLETFYPTGSGIGSPTEIQGTLSLIKVA